MEFEAATDSGPGGAERLGGFTIVDVLAVFQRLLVVLNKGEAHVRVSNRVWYRKVKPGALILPSWRVVYVLGWI